MTENDKAILKEAGLNPEHFEPINAPPIQPGRTASGAPPTPNQMADYFSGSISPSLQHDANFVKTQYGSPAVSTIALMPISPSGIPTGNSAIASYASVTATSSSIRPSSAISTQFFQVNGNPDILAVGSINGTPA